jgi:hypothetical protein
MKTLIKIAVFIFLIFGGFWIGMQWASISQKQDKKVASPQPTVVEKITPTPAPVVVSEVVPPVEEKTVEAQPAESILTKTLPNEEVIRYENARFKYSFDISKKVYYSGFWAQGGASHTVGIDKAGMPETLADASVRVYFYRNQILPELQNNTSTFYRDPAGKYIALLVDGKHSLKIEATDLQNPIVTRAIQSVIVK